MTSALPLDPDLIRAEFPAFREPSLEGWAFFENAGGSYTSRQVIDRLDHYYRATKVQPYALYPASREAGAAMDLAYRRMAQLGGKVWKEYGALEYVEAVADDVKPGKYTSFPQSVKLRKGEVVVFSYAIYKSRKHRDRVIAKVMKDKRFEPYMDPKKLPFDGKRMFWGGFKPIVTL